MHGSRKRSFAVKTALQKLMLFIHSAHTFPQAKRFCTACISRHLNLVLSLGAIFYYNST